MWILHENIERRIQTATEHGAFDNLPGQGQPLSLDDDTGVPESQRMAWRILKNAGTVPEGVSLRRDIADLEAHIAVCDPDSRCLSQRRLTLLRLRLEVAGSCDAHLLLGAGEYRKKVLEQLHSAQPADEY